MYVDHVEPPVKYAALVTEYLLSNGVYKQEVYYYVADMSILVGCLFSPGDCFPDISMYGWSWYFVRIMQLDQKNTFNI